MNENDKLHLWFKPYGNVLNEMDVSFIERYAKRFYPKAMTELAKQVHRLAAKVTRMCPAGAFEYQMTHYTRHANNRYVIEEQLRDASDVNGLNVGIQATTPDERRLFSECVTAEQTDTGATQPVQNVIRYLEDSLEMEPHRWENAKMQNGEDALPVLKEIIDFLKAVKNVVRIHTFELNYSQRGTVLTLCMLSPGVLSYYARIDWTIV